MARVTIEDCLEKVTNRFELSVAAMKRAKSIHSGSPSLSKEKNKPVAVSYTHLTLPTTPYV